MITTVDRDARHGHKAAAHGFDGYKGHVAVDPESELITATAVTPGNTGDASVAAELIRELLAEHGGGEPPDAGAAVAPDAPVVYGDQAYGTGAFQQQLDDAGIVSRCKTQRPTAVGGRFPKDRFLVDREGGTVRCPAGISVALRLARSGAGIARFGEACASCQLRADCTTSSRGRTIQAGVHEAALARARARQTAAAWIADYRATPPTIERTNAHLLRRKHGGRHARVRGTARVAQDFNWLAAVTNLARLAILGLRWIPSTGWTTA